nr:MAG TPA: hypothetical protein [Caudoviricetes sp.]
MFLFARQIDGGIFIGMACEKACLLIYGRSTRQQDILKRIE